MSVFDGPGCRVRTARWRSRRRPRCRCSKPPCTQHPRGTALPARMSSARGPRRLRWRRPALRGPKPRRHRPEPGRTPRPKQRCRWPGHGPHLQRPERRRRRPRGYATWVALRLLLNRSEKPCIFIWAQPIDGCLNAPEPSPAILLLAYCLQLCCAPRHILTAAEGCCRHFFFRWIHVGGLDDLFSIRRDEKRLARRAALELDLAGGELLLLTGQEHRRRPGPVHRADGLGSSGTSR